MTSLPNTSRGSAGNTATPSSATATAAVPDPITVLDANIQKVEAKILALEGKVAKIEAEIEDTTDTTVKEGLRNQLISFTAKETALIQRLTALEQDKRNTLLAQQQGNYET